MAETDHKTDKIRTGFAVFWNTEEKEEQNSLGGDFSVKYDTIVYVACWS